MVFWKRLIIILLLPSFVGISPSHVYAGDGSIFRTKETITGDNLLYRGWQASHRSDFQIAIKILEEALDEFQKTGDKQGEGKTLAKE